MNNDANQTQDRALHFREVYRLLNFHCKTGHTARRLAETGRIRAIRINDRTIRYSEASVLALLGGES